MPSRHQTIVLNEFGPPSRLTPAEAPSPVPGPAEALVEVEVVNITFVDTQIRSGRAPNPAMLPELPAVIGNGVGGRIGAVGSPEDSEYVGRRVISSTGGSGGYSERVAVPVAGLHEVPDGLGLPEAVALLADGRTAVSLLDTTPVEAGQTVLVEAAAGGVGSLLVQMLINRGAIVVGAARGEHKLGIARVLGATFVVDYDQPGWEFRVRDMVGSVDVTFDGVGGEIGRAGFELVRPGGRFNSYGMASGEFAGIDPESAAERRVTLDGGGPADPERMARFTGIALAEAAAGDIRPVIGQTFPLAMAADAHASIEARESIGKTLLLTGTAAS
ncbi:MAG TPA: zinc-binding dehydrogenase [Solirubrobacterales bacterium]|nr:zinc-binding dehydrogenase [Solirubrobacterales bacterium]